MLYIDSSARLSAGNEGKPSKRAPYMGPAAPWLKIPFFNDSFSFMDLSEYHWILFE